MTRSASDGGHEWSSPGPPTSRFGYWRRAAQILRGCGVVPEAGSQRSEKGPSRLPVPGVAVGQGVPFLVLAVDAVAMFLERDGAIGGDYFRFGQPAPGVREDSLLRDDQLARIGRIVAARSCS